MGRAKLTKEGWVAQARKVHSNHYDYSLVKELKYSARVKIICPTHGVFEQMENNHRNGAGCPTCGVKARSQARALRIEDVILRAKAVHKGEFEYPAEQVIKNNRSMLNFFCSVHGWQTQMVYAHLQGHGCPKCRYAKAHEHTRLKKEEVVSRARKIHGETYKYPGAYLSMHENMKIECAEHGVFLQTPSNHLKGSICPKCSARQKTSIGEQEVAEYVDGIVKMESNVRGVISPFEVDVWAPEQRVAIEYHGLYWHTDERTGREKHRRKYERAKEEGVTLVQIFSDEWENNREAVKMRLAAILGVCTKYDARKLTVTSPDKKRTRTFLEGRHTQGAGTSLSYSYALEQDGEIIALATFGKSRFKNSGWELLRYCSIGRVRGGISRLVTAFVREHSPEVLISYADLRWGRGDAYGAAGFELDSITEPDYWWTDGVERVARYRMQAHIVGAPEKEYAAQKGLLRITGVGHAKWVYKHA